MRTEEIRGKIDRWKAAIVKSTLPRTEFAEMVEIATVNAIDCAREGRLMRAGGIEDAVVRITARHEVEIADLRAQLAALRLAGDGHFSDAWRFAELLYIHGKTAKVRDKAWDWMQANRDEYGKTHNPDKVREAAGKP